MTVTPGILSLKLWVGNAGMTQGCFLLRAVELVMLAGGFREVCIANLCKQHLPDACWVPGIVLNLRPHCLFSPLQVLNGDGVLVLRMREQLYKLKMTLPRLWTNQDGIPSFILWLQSLYLTLLSE